MTATSSKPRSLGLSESTLRERPAVTASDRSAILTAAQQRAAAVLAHTGDPAAAARAGRCSERTLRRWRERPLFAQAVTEESRRVAAEARAALLGAQGEAVAALRAALTDQSAAVRVRAARALLEVGRHALDDDLEQRLADLERRTQQWHDEPTTSAWNGSNG